MRAEKIKSIPSQKHDKRGQKSTPCTSPRLTYDVSFLAIDVRPGPPSAPGVEKVREKSNDIEHNRESAYLFCWIVDKSAIAQIRNDCNDT